MVPNANKGTLLCVSFLLCLSGCTQPGENHRPLAVAGDEQVAYVGDTCELDGSSSIDPDGDALSFRWRIASAPQGSVATMTNTSATVSTFVPDVVGPYLVELVVSDGRLNSDPVTVEVSVRYTISLVGSHAIESEYGTDATGASGIEVSGDHAFVSYSSGDDVGPSGIMSFDITTPASPVQTDSIEWADINWAYTVHLLDAYLLIPADVRGIRVLDVSDPGTLGAGDRYPDAFAGGLCILGDLLMVSDSALGLRILDASTLPTLTPVGSLAVDGNPCGICALGTHAYLCAGTGGLAIIDVSDPGSPQLVSQYDTPAWVSGACAFDHYVYVVDNGIYILDVSDPAEPVLLSFFELPTFEWGGGIWKHGTRVFLNVNGVLVLDTADPAQPFIIGHYATSWPGELFVTDDYIFMTDKEQGFIILRLEE